MKRAAAAEGMAPLAFHRTFISDDFIGFILSDDGTGGGGDGGGGRREAGGQGAGGQGAGAGGQEGRKCVKNAPQLKFV